MPFVPYLCQNTSDSHLVGEACNDNAQQESQFGAVSHIQSSLDNSPDDLETSAGWKLEGRLYFATTQ